MAEHLTVDQVVEGSSPFAHPLLLTSQQLLTGMLIYVSDLPPTNYVH